MQWNAIIRKLNVRLGHLSKMKNWRVLPDKLFLRKAKCNRLSSGLVTPSSAFTFCFPFDPHHLDKAVVIFVVVGVDGVAAVRVVEVSLH